MHFPIIHLKEKAWSVMEKMLIKGKCKAIGVCNCTIKHLKEFLKHGNIVPAVN